MTIFVKQYPAPPINRDTVLRFSGCRLADDAVVAQLDTCLSQVLNTLSYRVCYGVFPITVDTDGVTFPFGSVPSRALAKHFNGCTKALLFAATVGIEMDRHITRAFSVSPTQALLLDAIGTERVESLCDVFCAEFDGTERFSPGYGDLPLSFQADLFRVLDCPRKIGLSLTDSLLMTPTKSVTAMVGLRR